MPLVGDISGSNTKDSRIGVTGSIVFAGADPDYASAFPAMGSDGVVAEDASVILNWIAL